MADRFDDERGTIRDLLPQGVDCVTHVWTRAGAVRGNHVHARTVQWTYCTRGSMLVSHGGNEKIIKAGDMVVDMPGEPHAWKALEDTEVLVFTRGPRSGEGYESDTERLTTPLLT